MKRAKIIGLALGLILSLNGVTAFASNTDRPFEFQLFLNQGNNYTVSRQKETGNDWSYVKNFETTYTSKVTYWIADDNKTQISQDVSIGPFSSFHTMYYNIDANAGDWVRLGAENYYNVSSYAYANGVVDYD